MEREAAERAYDELHKAKPFHDGIFKNWSPEWTPETQYHYRDGVTIWVSQHDLTPDDDFLGQSLPGTDDPDAGDEVDKP